MKLSTLVLVTTTLASGVYGTWPWSNDDSSSSSLSTTTQTQKRVVVDSTTTVTSTPTARSNSWFSSSKEAAKDYAYAKWTKKELEDWLSYHGVKVKKGLDEKELRETVGKNWEAFEGKADEMYGAAQDKASFAGKKAGDAYNAASGKAGEAYGDAQKAFGDIQREAYETWDEARLREWLIAQKVDLNKKANYGRQELLAMVRDRWDDVGSATGYVKDKVGDAGEYAAEKVGEAQDAVVDASKGVYEGAVRAFDASKDYVYSTWDEAQLKAWLEEKGVIQKKDKTQRTKDQLLALVNDSWGKVANPVWQVWSDSYLHGWLVGHHIIKSDYEKNRDDLLGKMNKYYYQVKDSVWTNWTDSELKAWLVDHGVMKSDAQASRDKMIKMVSDNYLSAHDTFWSAWSDNALKTWLVDHGYMRSDAQVQRDRLIALADEKWTEGKDKTADYLVWPDARLRAFLRRNGVDDSMIPGDRPGLLQETRIRYVQTMTKADSLFSKIKELVNSGVYHAEEVLYRVMHLLSGGWEETKEKAEDASDKTKRTWEDAGTKAKRDWEDTQKKARRSMKNVNEL